MERMVVVVVVVVVVDDPSCFPYMPMIDDSIITHLQQKEGGEVFPFSGENVSSTTYDV
jgi:hypothetical protein